MRKNGDSEQLRRRTNADFTHHFHGVIAHCPHFSLCPTRLLRPRRYHHRRHRTRTGIRNTGSRCSRPDIAPAIGAKTTFGIQCTTYLAVSRALKAWQKRDSAGARKKGVRYCGFDGIVLGFHRRQTENRRILHALLVILVYPGVTTICLGMTDKIENFDRSLRDE